MPQDPITDSRHEQDVCPEGRRQEQRQHEQRRADGAQHDDSGERHGSGLDGPPHGRGLDYRRCQWRAGGICPGCCRRHSRGGGEGDVEDAGRNEDTDCGPGVRFCRLS